MKKCISLKRNRELKNAFNEQYEVSLDYQKPDGYWVSSHKEHVTVQVAHGVCDKRGHAAAEAIAKQRYPNCRINSVTYC